MNKTLSEIEFETRTIGPLVLTTPFLRRLGLRETINRLCPVAEQADFDYGLVAELVVQCRLTAPRALYDMPGWAAMYDIATLYSDVDDAKQLNDDRVGRFKFSHPLAKGFTIPRDYPPWLARRTSTKNHNLITLLVKRASQHCADKT